MSRQGRETTIAFLQMALNSLAIRGLIANETRQRWKKVDTSVYIEQTLAVNSY